jgi:hypothetical protein
MFYLKGLTHNETGKINSKNPIHWEPKDTPCILQKRKKYFTSMKNTQCHQYSSKYKVNNLKVITVVRYGWKLILSHIDISYMLGW